MRAWKFAEHQVPEILGEGWKRLTKKFYGHSTYDVGHSGKWKHLKIDVKTRNRFSFHRLIESIRFKYCSFGQGKPILITREKGRDKCRQFYVTMEIELFKELLDGYKKD